MLEGDSNFIPRKCKLQNELWHLVEQEVVLHTDPKDLAELNKKSSSEMNRFGFGK
jgi:hypothetical protein